ncbi:radical SAM/SPASM domain-containing protein [Hippea jasoniae]|uniref:radical SAM/SPASM domain-containing protein n=1 Tax=Hippea jasoniae TaxID=944479 RepID=UPI00054FE50C|nr:radical SAM/SPASM domain-containing protein [Hippea jasoniae]
MKKKTRDYFMMPYSYIDDDWKRFSENYTKKEINELKEAATLPWPPETVLLDVGTICNLDCPFCFNHYGSKISIFDKKINSKEKLINFIKKNGPFKRLAFSGAGEPFLYPYFIEILEELEEYYESIHISTNAQTLKKKDIIRLSKLKIGSIIISTDGADKEIYESLRKGGKFEIFLENLKYLYNVFGDKISIMSVFFKQNSKSLLKFPKLLHNLGISNITLNMVKAVFHPDLDSNNFTNMEDDEILEFLEKLQDECSLYNLNLNFSSSSLKLNNLSNKLKQHKSIYTQRCRQPFTHFQINIDGEVNYCCGGLQTLPKDAFDGDPKQAWNDEEVLKFRIMMAAGYNLKVCKILCNKKFEGSVPDVNILKKILSNKINYSKDDIYIEKIIRFLEQNEYFKDHKIAIFGAGEFTKKFFKNVDSDRLKVEIFFDDKPNNKMINNRKVELFDESKITKNNINLILILSTLYEDIIEAKLSKLNNVKIIKLVSEAIKSLNDQ